MSFIESCRNVDLKNEKFEFGFEQAEMTYFGFFRERIYEQMMLGGIKKFDVLT